MTNTNIETASKTRVFDLSLFKNKIDERLLKQSDDLKKSEDLPPSSARLIAGVLGFFSSFMALGIPGIVLLIVDRAIPSASLTSLTSLALLGIGTAISVCLIDLLRMKALENYFINVRATVLYQDSCFAFFWAVLLSLIHPYLFIISLSAIGILYFFWRVRKKDPKWIDTNTGDGVDPVLTAATGLGPAYMQQIAEGKISEKAQPDFQTIGQSAWLNMILLLSTIATIIVVSWLHIDGTVTFGMMLATVFMNQYIVTIFIRFFQVQCLKPVGQDLSFISSLRVLGEKQNTPPAQSDAMEMLSMEEVEDFGFSPFSADVFQGLCLALIGPSGSGKSEILRAIATGQFYEGKISYKGKNWGRDHENLNSISYSTVPPISLEGSIVENITCFEPQANNSNAIELIRALDPFEDVFQDKDFVNDSIDVRNIAQSQIVSLARNFWRDSEIIILDQPETYLDKASRAGLLALILKAKTEGKIILISTDDDYLMSVADEVVKLERGEVTDRGPMKEVLRRHHQRWVRVSFTPTKRDAFRLTLWLDAQFPEGMKPELKDRVKQTTQDMLFFAPRDQILGETEEILFDVRMTPREVFITMHDRGDVISSDQIIAEEEKDFARIIDQTDSFEQNLRNGYRKISASFNESRKVVKVSGKSNG